MRADRLVSMVMLLQSHGKMTTATLAEQLSVSRRTILRDIDALSLAGVPIYTEGGHGGGVTLDEQYRTSLTGLQEAEVQALFIDGDQPLLEDLGLAHASQRSQRKLAAALPAAHRAAVDQLRQRIYIDPRWWWHETTPQRFWEDLQTAVYQDRFIQVIYENYSGNVTTRTLEPYSLVAKSALWYLVAREVNHAEKGWRTFRVARFHAVTLLPQLFTRDPSFDLPTYWQTHLDEFSTNFSDYQFILRIRPDRVQFARWLVPGRTQELSVDETGWVTLQFQIDNQELAQMLVFGLGEACEVIEPQSLWDAVQVKCQAFANSF